MSTHISKLTMRFRDSVTVYDEDLFKQINSCCEKESIGACLERCGGPFLRNFVKAAIIKFLFVLISKRSFAKALETMRFDVPRFGAIFGSVAAIFHLTLCFLRRSGKRSGQKWPAKMTDKMASFLAAFLCTLPMVLGLDSTETTLVKLVFYPLAWRCFYSKLIEVGLLPTFKHGDVLGYMLACFLVPYTYTMEPRSCSPPIHKMVLHYSRDPRWENRVYDIVKTGVR